MSFPAFFDTNFPYGALLNDVILELADRGLFRPLWSEDVLFELAKNLVKNGEDPNLVVKRVSTMERYFADAMVTGYEDLAPTMTNDEKDRHVLAVAVRGGAEVLVTFNTRAFPADSVEPFDLEVVHPDDFLLDQLDLHHGATLRTLVKFVDGYGSPAMTGMTCFSRSTVRACRGSRTRLGRCFIERRASWNGSGPQLDLDADDLPAGIVEREIIARPPRNLVAYPVETGLVRGESTGDVTGVIPAA